MSAMDKSTFAFYTFDESKIPGTVTTYSGTSACVECTEPSMIIYYSVSSNNKFLVVGYKNGKVFTGSINGYGGAWTLIMTFP